MCIENLVCDKVFKKKMKKKINKKNAKRLYCLIIDFPKVKTKKKLRKKIQKKRKIEYTLFLIFKKKQ